MQQVHDDGSGLAQDDLRGEHAPFGDFQANAAAQFTESINELRHDLMPPIHTFKQAL